MRADTTNRVFTNFTLNNGDNITRAKTTLFFF
jgi:hypothetical protein